MQYIVRTAVFSKFKLVFQSSIVYFPIFYIFIHVLIQCLWLGNESSMQYTVQIAVLSLYTIPNSCFTFPDVYLLKTRCHGSRLF